MTFPLPTATGGRAPLSVSCTPTSGSLFAAGATPVNCSATDAAAQIATCRFTVAVEAIPALAVTKFLAFGDSVTQGQNGTPEFGFDVIDTPNAYPTKLQTLLDSNYPGQGIDVANEGFGGERIEAAKVRLPGVLVQRRPGALLLIDGYNNLTFDCAFNSVTPACDSAIEFVVGTLREMVRIARNPPNQVSYVFVGTLTPPGSVGGLPDRRIASGAITRVNAKVRQLIPGEGAVVVDLYPRFLGREQEYIAGDGLHILPAGNQVIAGAFFEAIQMNIPRTIPAANLTAR